MLNIGMSTAPLHGFDLVVVSGLGHTIWLSHLLSDDLEISGINQCKVGQKVEGAKRLMMVSGSKLHLLCIASTWQSSQAGNSSF